MPLFWNYIIMKSKKLKVGDSVRIIDCSAIESYELNKIGIIVGIPGSSHIVDMGRPRRQNVDADNETCWWLQESMIELVNKPNTQLLFDFMY